MVSCISEKVDPWVLGTAHQPGRRGSGTPGSPCSRALSTKLEGFFLLKAGLQYRAEGRSCANPVSFLGTTQSSPAELHQASSKNPHKRGAQPCAPLALQEGKKLFLQMFPIHWDKFEPGISQCNAQRSCIRNSLPC